MNTINLQNDIHYKTIDSFGLGETIIGILNTCKTKNILIYLESSDSYNTSKNVNEALARLSYLLPNKKKFLNVSIINLCEVLTHRFLVFTPVQPIFRNVLNISHGDYTYKTTTAIQGRNYTIQNMDTSSVSRNYLVDQWWFKFYNNIPACASGRLQQFTGTCWFNAALNVLLLSETTQSLLIAKWLELPENEKEAIINLGGLENCLLQTAPLKTMLFMVIYNILIKHIKLSRENGNWIKELAGATQSLIKTQSEEFYAQLKVADLQNNENLSNSYGVGGYADKALEVILGVLFRSSEYKIIKLGWNAEKLGMLIKQRFALNKFNMSHTVNWNLGYLNALSISKKWSNNENESIILFAFPNNGCRKLQQNIKIKGNIYHLESASIYLQLDKDNLSGHIIAGLKCGSKWYVYDSNNKICSCDWTNGDLSNYKTELIKQKSPYRSLIISMYFSSAIYVKAVN